VGGLDDSSTHTLVVSSHSMLPQFKLTQPESDLARALRSNAAQISDSVAQALETIPRWKKASSEYPGERSEYVALQFQAFADYAAQYFDRNDKTYFQLLVGEMLKALHDPALDGAAAGEQALRVMTALRQDLLLKLSQSLSPEAQIRLSEFLDELSRFITLDPGKVQRVLFVGDCLFLDVLPFIAVSLLDVGIRLAADYATSKNSAILRDQLRAFGAKKFDLIFYSPYTYEFSVEYNELLSWKNAFAGETAVIDRAKRVWRDTSRTIDILADLFDCPIHVHNSSAIIRDHSAAKRLIKAKATARIRSLGRATINSSLPEYLNGKNAESFRHLFLFDEKSLVDEFGEMGAGAYIYKTKLQHPAVLGRVLSRQYIDLIFVNAWLVNRKVIVCDLDNTLWEGVIGEGSVTHYHKRQQTLKMLRTKGVLLAINSKNDPANVRWDEGTLSDQDFVCAAISWEPKVRGMQRIQSALNLKTRDFVFVDDRADERALMRETYPEMLCLDATDENTWKRVELWASLLDDDPDMDRTLMYKQRELRKAFVQEDVSSPEERDELYLSLDLRLTIRSAKQSDLKRVAELINRTNQFNLDGSRTTIREVTQWHESPDHVILLGDSADRFGGMGTTCVAVARCRDTEMRILPFVLSCRVFGFGIEFGVMNHLKAIARERGARRILGRYKATPQNAPSKDFLPASGFLRLDEDVWSMDIDAESPPTPSWLTVAVA
jgi:FkbH-like protein